MRRLALPLCVPFLLACHTVASKADASVPLDAGAADAGAPDAGLPPVVIPAEPGAEIPESGGLHNVRLTMSGSLEGTLTAKLPKEVALPLTQVTARILVWWVDVRKDLRRGDVLEIVYSLPPGKDPLVHAVRLTSSEVPGRRAAYLFQAPGAPFARLYSPDGKEIEERLVDGPIDGYEQITSLLRDGRRHHGVDFKTPIGTPVKMPFDGVVARRNWSFRRNGNCLDLFDPASGRHALFLHLSPLPAEPRAGQRLKKGDVVAQSGNTGRTTAPHLHYQLVSPSGGVLDPFVIHRTWRAELPAEARAAFQAEVARLERYFARE